MAPATDWTDTAALRERLEALEAEAAAIRRALNQPAPIDPITRPDSRFGKLAEAVPGLMFESVPDGNVFVNRFYAEFTGLTPEELLGDGWMQVVHPEDLARIAPQVAQMNETGGDGEYELRIRRHDGAWRWFLLRCVSLTDETGRVARWFSVGIDIHERKQGELELQHNEARLRTLAEAVPGLMFEGTERGNDYVNRFYADYTGLPAARLLGFGWTEVVHPGDLAPLGETLAVANRDGAGFRAECRIRRHDGTWRWFLLRSLPMWDAEAGMWRWFGIGLDIHDRHEAEAALRESEQRLAVSEETLRLAVEATELGTWDLNLRTQELTWSAQCKALFGISTDRPVTLDDFYAGLHPEDRARITEVFARAINPQVRGDYDVEYRTIGLDDGIERWVNARGRALFDAEGRGIRAVGTVLDITARKRDEAALRESEAMLRLATEATGLGTWHHDIPEDRLTWSPRAHEIFGFDPEETPDLAQFWSQIHPDDVARVSSAFARATDPAGDGRYECDYRLRDRRTGRERWVSVRGQTVFRGGAAVLAIGTALDISERKADEAALRQRDTMLQLAAEAGGLGTWSVTYGPNPPAATDVIWSPRCREIFGLLPDETFTPQTFWDRVHPDDHESARQRYAGAFLPGSDGRYDSELRMSSRDGRMRWVMISGQVIFDAGGRPVQALGTALDITERKRSEMALREGREALRRTADELERRVAERTAQLAESEARFRAYFESVEDCLFTVDVTPDGQFLHGGYNPHGEQRSGYRNADIAGRPPAAFMTPELAQAVETSFRRVCTHGTSRFTRRLRFPAGEGVFDTLMVPMRDAAGRVVRILAASREVTEQVRLEEELRQTQKMQAIGQLTGGVAHDFNNLLTGIVGSLELLQRDVTGERAQRLIAAARRSAQRGAQLTGQLLAFSRRQQLETKPTDLNALVAGMAGMLRSTLGGSVGVQTVLRPGLWPAMADATQLELAILNLAINARDAMPDGGTVTIETENVHTPPPRHAEDPPQGSFVAVTVSDPGTGMPAEVLARIFEPFFTTKQVGRGSGLGLPQVLGVAKQLGGGVAVESAPGAGTMVRIYLPRAQATEAPAPERNSAAGGNRLPAGRVVLLVDDDAEVREIATGLLESLGCLVVRAASGQDALDALAQVAQIDAVLLDYAMPGMNGPETANRLRAARPGLHIVFATGYADATALQVLGAPVVRKPFEAADLAAVLAPLLAGPLAA